LPSELAAMMYGYKFWNNGKYELIAAGSTGKRLEWEGVWKIKLCLRERKLVLFFIQLG
jgi:hypothetical protein